MLIPAKYNGKCAGCGDPIVIGEQISWTRGSSAVFHAGCSTEGQAAAKAAQASRATDADIELACPPGLEYMPFQRAGIAFALSVGKTRRGVLFGDAPGLGKTIQVLGWINNETEINSVLVICPKSLTINWMREARKWLTRDFKVSCVPGCGDVVVMSYEGAKKYSAQLDRKWGLVVVDEAHLVKNPKAQRSKAVAAIVAKASRRALLTGTPIPNRPIELFPLMAMVDPAEWDPNGKGFFRFALRDAAAHNSTGYWDFSGASNLDELQQRLRSTNMIRRTKEQVLTELPKKRRQVIELPANGAAKAVEAEKAAWDRLESRLEDLRAAVELSKASDDPADFDSAVRALSGATKTAFTDISKQRHAVAVAKVPHVIEHATTCLEDADGKLLIWVHHHDVGDAIREGLSEFGVVGIDGRNSSEERDAAVQRFQNDPNVRVFVGGISAAGVGLTLTASAHEIFAELDWVPGNMLQAEDRAHRIGQLESVLVQLMVLEGSLDARMASVLVDKMAVAEAGLDADTRRNQILPTAQPPATAGTVRELAEVAAKLSATDVAEVHAALRRLAGLCDGAAAIDGQGFSKIDVRIGHSLANAPRLSPKQAALGVKLCRKYRKQLGEGCWSNL